MESFKSPQAYKAKKNTDFLFFVLAVLIRVFRQLCPGDCLVTSRRALRISIILKVIKSP